MTVNPGYVGLASIVLRSFPYNTAGLESVFARHLPEVPVQALLGFIA